MNIKKRIYIVKDVILKFYRELRWYEKIQWGILLITLAFSFLTMCYEDVIYMVTQSYVILEMLVKGENAWWLLFSSNYGFTLFLVYMIWNIPMLFIRAILGKSFWLDQPFPLLWNKILLLIFTGLMLYAMKRILELCGKSLKKNSFLYFATCSSAFYLLTVVQLTQYDIIGLALGLLGIVFYLEEREWLFLLIFAIANPMKYLTLMIFIPLVLLREKDIIKAGIKMLAGVSLIGVNIVMRYVLTGGTGQAYNAIVMQELTGQGNNAITDEAVQAGVSYIIQNVEELPVFLGGLLSDTILFVMAYGMICILAYCISWKNCKKEWAVYIPFLVYSIFLLLCDWPAYRGIIICPFLFLIIFLNRGFINLGLIGELGLSVSMCLYQIQEKAWVIGGERTFEHFFFKGRTIHPNMATMLNVLYNYESYLPLIKTAFATILISMMIIYCPPNAAKIRLDDEKPQQIIIWGKVLFIAGWTFLTAYTLLFM